jgi:transposase
MRKSRLSKKKQKRLMEHFVAGTMGRTAASLAGVNKSIAAYYFFAPAGCDLSGGPLASI